MNSLTTQPNREKAVKLALLLGWAGAHRFYTNQVVFGLAYLVFCWTLIPGVLSLIDAAFLARMSDDDFAEEFCAHPQGATLVATCNSPIKSRNSVDLTA